MSNVHVYYKSAALLAKITVPSVKSKIKSFINGGGSRSFQRGEGGALPKYMYVPFDWLQTPKFNDKMSPFF